ncbi:MAG: FecR family protein, partial [Lachnospiraceae bacterium]|nr:FecR family protein [Lachnospiraceae bacterium]
MNIFKTVKKCIAGFLMLVMVLTLILPVQTIRAAESYSMIKLDKTQGSVSVSNSASRSMTARTGMRLLNGYQVSTDLKSYAWMILDSTKGVKLDSKSKVQVRTMGKKMELMLLSGNLFFNVSKKLEKDEELNIRTSTMVTGIRGTIGYVTRVSSDLTLVGVLEGAVQCESGGSKFTTVSAGQVASIHEVGSVKDENGKTNENVKVDVS